MRSFIHVCGGLFYSDQFLKESYGVAIKPVFFRLQPLKFEFPHGPNFAFDLHKLLVQHFEDYNYEANSSPRKLFSI